MDGAAQRMLESRKQRRTGILIALAVSTLPMCDACEEANLETMFAGAGLGGSPASALWPCVVWLAIAGVKP